MIIGNRLFLVEAFSRNVYIPDYFIKKIFLRMAIRKKNALFGYGFQNKNNFGMSILKLDSIRIYLYHFII